MRGCGEARMKLTTGSELALNSSSRVGAKGDRVAGVEGDGVGVGLGGSKGSREGGEGEGEEKSEAAHC